MVSHVWPEGNRRVRFTAFVILRNCYVIAAQICSENDLTFLNSNQTASYLPYDWPCHWSKGHIPYSFNFYSHNANRLVSVVLKGLEHIEKRSCLTFYEDNPVKLANKKNFTYLFFTYSGVLETCCSQYYSKISGRRLVLITPTCSLPDEAAHATLHGLGLRHERKKPFNRDQSSSVLFSNTENCSEVNKKKELLKLD